MDAKQKYLSLYKFQYYVAQRLIKTGTNDPNLSRKINFILDLHNLFFENPNLLRGQVINTGFVDKIYNDSLQLNFLQLIMQQSIGLVWSREKLKFIPHHYFSSTNYARDISNTLGESRYLIDLGGGTGRLLYHIAKFYSNKHTNAFPLLVNAEFNDDARAISDLLLSAISYPEQSFKAMKFDYYNSAPFFDSLLGIISERSACCELSNFKIHFISAASIEQIPILPDSFFEGIKFMCNSNHEVTFSFYEPVLFQMPQFINQKMANRFKKTAIDRNHNQNLCSKLLELIDNKKLRISKIVPLVEFLEDEEIGMSLIQVKNDISDLARRCN